jgi:hypothetical protein
MIKVLMGDYGLSKTGVYRSLEYCASWCGNRRSGMAWSLAVRCVASVCLPRLRNQAPRSPSVDIGGSWEVRLLKLSSLQ